MARPLPADLEDALAASPAARERFWSLPADRKDAWVRWVERARFPRARRRRIGETVRRLAGAGGALARENVESESVAAVPVPRSGAGAWLAGLALLAALAAFLVWFVVYRHNDPKAHSTVVVTAKTTVPKVVGIRYQSAVFQLKEAKLASRLVRRAAAKPRGIVVGQGPKAGATAPQGTLVTLVVSNGPPGVKMPDVVGLAASDAVKALQARKLAPALDQVASQQAPGTVVSQEPKAGARAKPGTKVVLRVAKGEAAVATPDVTGEQSSQAVSALRQAGLAARVVRVLSSQPSGTVVAQRPAAGQKAAKGSTVRLNVSSGASTSGATTSTPTTTQAQTTTAPAGGGNDYTGLRLQTPCRGSPGPPAGDRPVRRVEQAGRRRRLELGRRIPRAAAGVGRAEPEARDERAGRHWRGLDDRGAGSAVRGLHGGRGAVARVRRLAGRHGRVRDPGCPGTSRLGDRDLRRLCRWRLRPDRLRFCGRGSRGGGVGAAALPAPAPFFLARCFFTPSLRARRMASRRSGTPLVHHMGGIS